MKIETSESIHDVLERIKILELKMTLVNRRPEELVEAALQTFKSKLMRQIDCYIEDAFAKHLMEFMKLAKGVTLGLEKVEKKVLSLEAMQESLLRSQKLHKLTDNSANRKSSGDLLANNKDPKTMFQDSPRSLLKTKPLSEQRHSRSTEEQIERERMVNEFMVLEVPKTRTEKDWEEGLEEEEGFLWGKEMNTKVKYFEADRKEPSTNAAGDSAQDFEFVTSPDNLSDVRNNAR